MNIQALKGPYPTRALAEAGGEVKASPKPDFEEVEVSFQRLRVDAKDLQALDTVLKGWKGSTTATMEATRFPAVLVKVEAMPGRDGNSFGKAHVALADSDYDWAFFFSYDMQFNVDRPIAPVGGPSEAWRASVICDRNHTYYPAANELAP